MSKKPDYPEELPAILEAKIANAEGYYNSNLSREREDVQIYLNREAPRRSKNGNSTFVSTDVLDSVEGMRAQLISAYSNGQDIVRFTATAAEDVEPAREATAYTKYTVFEANDGYNIMQDCIIDGLVARMGVVKVWWDDASEDTEEEFDGLDVPTIMGLSAQSDITRFDHEQDEDSDGNPLGTFSGKLTRTKDTSQVRIENICPEEFFVEKGAKSLKKAFCAHCTPMTKSEIKALGYDVTLLKDAPPDGDNIGINEEVVARNSRLDPALSVNDGIMRTQEMKYRFWECYVHLTSPENRPALYKVVRVSKVILDFEEVKRVPFIIYVPIRRSHMIEGENFAALSIQTQAARTQLYRAALDHTSRTTNPIMMVGPGGLNNPDELLNNRGGGIVNVKAMDQLAPMQMPQLNPAVFALTTELKALNESTTGISATSMGLDPEVISNQNSTAMVSQQIDLSMQKTKVIAQNFARNFLRPLFIEVYTLILENDKQLQKHTMQIAGQFVPVDISKWIARKDTEVTMHLSADDATQEAQKLVSFITMASQSPIASMIQPKNWEAIGHKVLTLGGFVDVNTYMTPLSQVPPPKPPQPDPIKMGELQVAQQKAQLEAQKAQWDHEYRMAHLQLEAQKLALQEKNASVQNMVKVDDMHRKSFVAMSNIDTEQREMTLLENTPMTQGTAMDAPKPAPG